MDIKSIIRVIALLFIMPICAEAGFPPLKCTGENYLSCTPANRVTVSAVNLASSNVTGVLPVANSVIATQALTESAGATTVDWSTGNGFSLTLNANNTFTFSNKASGQTIVIRVTNTASNFTVTWPAVKWVGGVAPTQTIGAHADVYTFFYDGTDVYGNAVQNF